MSTEEHFDWSMFEGALSQLAEEFDVPHDHLRTDSVYNAYSGLGDPSQDPSVFTEPRLGHRQLAMREVDEQYEHGRFARRLIESGPNDCTKNGWRMVVAEDDRSDPVSKYFKRLQVKQKTREAHVLANLTGGAGILPVTDDDAPLHEPLNVQSVRRVKALHVFDAEELKPERGPNQDLDSARGSFDVPETYRLTPHAGVGQVSNRVHNKVVHSSRILRFEGPYVRRARRHLYDGWGQPLIEAIWRPLRDLETATQALVSTIHEFKYGVLKVQDLKWLLTGPQGDQDPSRLMARLRVMILTKSLIKAVVLDAEKEDYETREINLQGIDIAYAILQQNLSSSAHQSLTKLFGQAPKGFTSEDETGQENWRDHVEGLQHRWYHPALMRLAEILMIANEGELPRDYDIVFEALRTQTDADKAATYAKVAEGDNKYWQMGVLTEDEMHTRFERSNFGIDLVLEEDVLASSEELGDMQDQVSQDEADEEAAPAIDPVPEDLVSQRAAGEAMGVPTHTISALCRKGKLRYWKLGRHKQVSMADVISLGRQKAEENVQTDAEEGPRYMLATYPPPEFARRLEQEAEVRGIELRDDLHVTLVYLGRRSKQEDPTIYPSQVAKALQPVFEAWRQRPRLKVSGAGMFFNGPERVAHLLVNGVGFSELRTALSIHLSAEGLLPHQEHGFSPHITMKYFEPHEDVPSDWATIGATDYPEWVVDEIKLVREDTLVETFTIG